MYHQAEERRTFLLTASLPKVMWKLALPAIAAMILYGLNSFMDTVYVGQLMNETALAGIAIAFPLAAMTMGFSFSGRYWCGQLTQHCHRGKRRRNPKTTPG